MFCKSTIATEFESKSQELYNFSLFQQGKSMLSQLSLVKLQYTLSIFIILKMLVVYASTFLPYFRKTEKTPTFPIITYIHSCHVSTAYDRFLNQSHLNNY